MQCFYDKMREKFFKRTWFCNIWWSEIFNHRKVTMSPETSEMNFIMKTHHKNCKKSKISTHTFWLQGTWTTCGRCHVLMHASHVEQTPEWNHKHWICLVTPEKNKVSLRILTSCLIAVYTECVMDRQRSSAPQKVREGPDQTARMKRQKEIEQTCCENVEIKLDSFRSAKLSE